MSLGLVCHFGRPPAREIPRNRVQVEIVPSKGRVCACARSSKLLPFARGFKRSPEREVPVARVHICARDERNFAVYVVLFLRILIIVHLNGRLYLSFRGRFDVIFRGGSRVLEAQDVE